MRMLKFLVIIMLCSEVSCFAEENYLQMRYGINLKTDAREKYFLFENNQQANWAFGAKVVMNEQGFIFFNPYVCYKLTNEMQVGFRYLYDSQDNDFIAPEIRYIKKFQKLFMFFDAIQYFNLKNQKHKTDIWLHISTTGLGWYYGTEVWYYHTQNSSQNFNLRPVKLGYRFENGITPFAMYEHHWEDRGSNANSVYFGIEIKY